MNFVVGVWLFYLEMGYALLYSQLWSFSSTCDVIALIGVNFVSCGGMHSSNAKLSYFCDNMFLYQNIFSQVCNILCLLQEVLYAYFGLN